MTTATDRSGWPRFRRPLALVTLLAACGGADGWHGGIDTTAAELVLQAGDGASGAPGELLTGPLVVRVTNAAGNGLQGKQVTFTSTTGATFDPATASADASGRARTTVRLGSWVGAQTVVARVNGLEQQVEFSLTGEQPSAVTIEAISGDVQEGNVGTTLPLPLVVRVSTVGDDPKPLGGVLVQWQTSGGQLSQSSTVTGLSGTAQVVLQLPSEPGPVTISATVPGMAANTSFLMTVR